MIETAQSLVGKLTSLAVAAAVVIAIGMILWAWVVKRTVSAVIGVIILAAIVLFAINATDWLRDKVGEDVGAYAPPGRVLEMAAPPSVGGIG
jgi:drug/metabolite transporter (DMT)-like permease